MPVYLDANGNPIQENAPPPRQPTTAYLDENGDPVGGGARPAPNPRVANIMQARGVPAGDVATAARNRLAARGTSPEEVKRRAAADESISPEDPTMGERVGADIAATVEGTGALLGGTITGAVEGSYNIVTAGARPGLAAVSALAHGGSVEDAAAAARDVKPERRLEELSAEAAADAGRTVRGWLGVRPKTIVPQEDVMREVPGLIATFQGIRGTAGHLRVQNVLRARGVPETAETIPEAIPESAPTEATRTAAPTASAREELFKHDAAVKAAEEDHLAAVARAKERLQRVEPTAFGKRPRGAVSVDGEPVEFMTPKNADALYEDLVGPTRERLAQARAARDAFHESLVGQQPASEVEGLTPSQIDRLVESTRLGNPNAAREVPAKLRQALGKEVSGDEASIRRFLSANPDVAAEVRAGYEMPAEPTDEELMAEAQRRAGGQSPASATRQALAADQYRLSPEAAIARENLPVDEFIRQRFPKATVNEDAGPEWVKAVLSRAPEGKPGIAVEDATPELRAQGFDRQIVYRDPEGRPIAVAMIFGPSEGGEGVTLVRDFAIDKSQGLLAGRAAGAVAQELDRLGVTDHFAEISPDAARFIQKAEALKARRGGGGSGGSGSQTPPGAPGAPPSSGGSTPPPAPPSAPAAASAPPPGVQAAAADPTPSPPELPPMDSKEYSSALRVRYTGALDIRKAEGNQIANHFRKSMAPAEREGLSFLRDEKAYPGEAAAALDGTHPAYAKMTPAEVDTAKARIEGVRAAVEQGLNPTDAMRQADALSNAYFEKTLAEGKDLGFLDSSIDSTDYVPHLLQPFDAEPSDGGYGDRASGVRRNTPSAIKRHQGSLVSAIIRGIDPRTLDAADALSIYADRHGHAAAARILENTLKDSDLGKVLTSGNVPEGWKKLGGGNSVWDREVPIHDRSGEESKLAVVHQSLYVPEKIAKALSPITDPNYMLKVPGWRFVQRFQDYIKSSEVALAFFHLKAETINAFNNMRTGPVDMAKSFMISLDDPTFMQVERTAVQHGMKTSIVQQTAEAYGALMPRELPSRVDAIRNFPVVRTALKAAEATSKLTFDIAIRKYKVMDFASQDAGWIAEHPHATDTELATARRSIAREVNAVYGGLNWEALGINRTLHALMRAAFFAPDWAYSNVDTANMALTKGGPGGNAARFYFARSLAGGIAATAAMTYFLTGKKPGEVPGRMKDKLFNVYMGKDEKGNDKFMNLFFAGAVNDAVNLSGNVIDYGIGKGVGATIANKLAVLPRTTAHVLITNKDFMGRDIVPQGAGFVAGTAISAKAAAGEMAPLPFGATNAAQMATDPKREYSPAEYAAAIVGGVRPRHVPPPKPERPRNSTWDIIRTGKVYKGRR